MPSESTDRFLQRPLKNRLKLRSAFGIACARDHGMTPQELRERTRRFAGRARKFCRPYLRDRDIDTCDAARQFIRASASVGSGYRSVCLSRSHEEFVARIAHVLEEADECKYWARYLRDDSIDSAELLALLNEATELCRIFGASLSTSLARPRDQQRPSNRSKALRKKQERK